VGHPLRREDESVICSYNCYWALPEQSLWGPSPTELTIFYSHLRLPQPAGPDPSIYIPQEQGGPVTPPGTGFHFRRILLLAGLRCRYSSRHHRVYEDARSTTSVVRTKCASLNTWTNRYKRPVLGNAQHLRSKGNGPFETAHKHKRWS
jgi:hypothetical protein